MDESRGVHTGWKRPLTISRSAEGIGELYIVKGHYSHCYGFGGTVVWLKGVSKLKEGSAVWPREEPKGILSVPAQHSI